MIKSTVPPLSSSYVTIILLYYTLWLSYIYIYKFLQDENKYKPHSTTYMIKVQTIYDNKIVVMLNNQAIPQKDFIIQAIQIIKV